jgi:nitroimidazol reductase NimA-like FMN-containing flavoprotein (pyridoxamine 5'-phosphate oxidase superfamily)
MESNNHRSEYIVSMDELDTDVCWRLLARTRFGRVGFVADGELRALPVNCGVLKRQVVFRTGSETTLGRLVGGSSVTFECDHTDPVAESGWSVVVKGHIWRVDDANELARLSEFDVHPWAPGVRDRWMKIIPTQVTGRVITRRRDVPTGVHVPYMRPD